MKFKSPKFIKGLMGDDDLLHDGKSQIAFVGRSNVGKSSIINSLAQATIARSSDRPGKTKEINVYQMNSDLYFVDLPGYGYARASLEERENLRKLVFWYLFYSDIANNKIVLVIDANIGFTEYDTSIFKRLKETGKKTIVVANKVDKIKKSEMSKKVKQLSDAAGKIIPYSTKDKIGIKELLEEIAKDA